MRNAVTVFLTLALFMFPVIAHLRIFTLIKHARKRMPLHKRPL
jgi:hypothetical protein